MANIVIYVLDVKTMALLPVKALDNGDGTYKPPINIIIALMNNEVKYG